MSTVAIIQARMGSSRLPGKVLERFAGEPALAHVVARARACRAIDEVIVATTLDPRDDILVATCAERGWPCARGSEADVLDRYYQVAVAAGATHVVRLTSDCPALDPAVVDELCAKYAAAGADYGSTSWPRATFPLGISAEIMRADALAEAWRDDRDPAWREHVTPYLYRHPERFRIIGHGCEADYAHHRWTLDTPEDAALLTKLFDHFGTQLFAWRDAVALVEAHPEWAQINAAIVQRVVT